MKIKILYQLHWDDIYKTKRSGAFKNKIVKNKNLFCSLIKIE